MEIPADVNYIINRLEESCFTAFIVGGCVRDMIMGKEPKDWDITTSATPEEVKALFKHTYDTGLKHGTVTVVLNSLKYEITTFRIDGEYKDSRHPEQVTFSSDICDDLKRRDFTANAIAYNTKSGFVDPYGGINDIKNKILRGVGNADERIKEDALRMLRAVRFSATLGFIIEQNTKQAIMDNGGLISKISAERVREELIAIIMSSNTDVIFSKEFSALIGVIYKPLRESLITNEHILSQMLAACKKNVALRLTVLIYFLSTEDASGFLKYLKLSNTLYKSVYELHTIKSTVIEAEYYNVAKTISKWGLDVFEDYLYIQMLNCIVLDTSIDYIMKIEEYYNLIKDDKLPVFIKDLHVSGYNLKKEFNIAGIIIGKTLNGLLDFVHKNPYKNSHDVLIREAHKLITKDSLSG